MEKIILTERNFSRLKEQVIKNKNREIVFSSDDDELNRKVLEKLKIDILLINLEGRKDFSKQRNSGLNSVLLKVAEKKGIKIGINLDEIVQSKEKERVLSRLRQNILLCKKNRVDMVFVSKNEKKEKLVLKSLGLVLGMPTWMVRNI